MEKLVSSGRTLFLLIETGSCSLLLVMPRLEATWISRSKFENSMHSMRPRSASTTRSRRPGKPLGQISLLHALSMHSSLSIAFTRLTGKHPSTRKRRVPKEDEQFKAYLKYADSALKPNTPRIFSKELTRLLTLYGIERPIEELQAVDLVNATKKLKNLAQQLPGEFGRIWRGKAGLEEFFPSACAVLKFVYEVRCNLFHGTKTTVQLLDSAQQRRLLIYTATLIAGNSLLFRVAEKANVGWQNVRADFTLPAGEA